MTFGKVHYMEPELKTFSFSETQLSVYEGQIYFKATVTVSPQATDSVLLIRGYIYYQACNDVSCLAPQTVEFSQNVPLAADAEAVQARNEQLFRMTLAYFKEEAVREGELELARLVRESGWVYTLLFIFIGGLALNLTPCVYPLIPITISYFAGQSTEQTPRSGRTCRGLCSGHGYHLFCTGSAGRTYRGITGQCTAESVGPDFYCCGPGWLWP